MSEETMDFSASSILRRMRDGLKNPVNKIEGGFSMDNLQAVAEEMARMDAMEVQPIPDHVLLDTAEGEYLDRKALDYNETRNPATVAVGTLVFTGETGAVIPLGTEALAGTLAFQTTAEAKISSSGTCSVPAECQTAGPGGNVEANAITALRVSVVGVRAVNNPEPFMGGTAAESDESFRQRIYDKIRRPITSGNRNHYIYWAKQVSGVGGAKCLGAEVCGKGQVRVIVLSDTFTEPDGEILENVEGHIEDERPIGPEVTVVAASPVEASIKVSVKLSSGYQADTIQTAVREALQVYINEVNKEDFNTAPTHKDEGRKSSISYYRIGDLIFGVDGVTDITSYTLNGALASLESGYEEFFKLKEVVVSADQ